jgi:hypothetical protein
VFEFNMNSLQVNRFLADSYKKLDNYLFEKHPVLAPLFFRTKNTGVQFRIYIVEHGPVLVLTVSDQFLLDLDTTSERNRIRIGERQASSLLRNE